MDGSSFSTSAFHKNKTDNVVGLKELPQLGLVQGLALKECGAWGQRKLEKTNEVASMRVGMGAQEPAGVKCGISLRSSCRSVIP